MSTVKGSRRALLITPNQDTVGSWKVRFQESCLLCSLGHSLVLQCLLLHLFKSLMRLEDGRLALAWDRDL